MRILVFTSQLAGRTGGEVNVRDWALGLRLRGHNVVVYAPVLGSMAEEIRNAGVGVVRDPASLTDTPDVMFGSGINEVAALSARFPDVPMVQVSQQWDNWASFPSPLPQVMLHVAVDELNAESLANEFGLSRERIRIVHNAVDLARMHERERPLPAAPQRALIFVKQNTPYVEAVQAAFSRRCIAAELVGPGVGAVIEDPLAAIACADLVVGAARIAIEGAAAGAAVLVADHRGLAGMLTPQNFEHFRANNFGRAVLTRPLDLDVIGSEIDRYDAADAAAATAIMRETASLTRQLERLEAIFSQAMALFREAPPPEEARRKALAAYLAQRLSKPADTSRRDPEDGADAWPARLTRHLSSISERLSALELDHTGSGPSTRSATDRVLPGPNLLEQSEVLDTLFGVCSIATVERADTRQGESAVFLVSAIGGMSEHYIQHALSRPGGEALTFSLEAREAAAPKIRIQLLDADQNGLYGDFDFSHEGFSICRIANGSRVNGGFRPLGNGWYKLWITAVLPRSVGCPRFIIQLSDRNGQFSYWPGGESVMVRALQVEPGQLPSPYQPGTMGPSNAL